MDPIYARFHQRWGGGANFNLNSAFLLPPPTNEGAGVGACACVLGWGGTDLLFRLRSAGQKLTFPQILVILDLHGLIDSSLKRAHLR